jgi:hypothetical protein
MAKYLQVLQARLGLNPWMGIRTMAIMTVMLPHAIIRFMLAFVLKGFIQSKVGFHVLH